MEFIQSQVSETRRSEIGRRHKRAEKTQKAAQAAGIEECIAAHGLRKTFGYWHYKYNKDIRILMDIFNHSSEDITLRYIGVTDEQKKESMQFMNMGIKEI